MQVLAGYLPFSCILEGWLRQQEASVQGASGNVGHRPETAWHLKKVCYLEAHSDTARTALLKKSSTLHSQVETVGAHVVLAGSSQGVDSPGRENSTGQTPREGSVKLGRLVRLPVETQVETPSHPLPL